MSAFVLNKRERGSHRVEGWALDQSRYVLDVKFGGALPATRVVSLDILDKEHKEGRRPTLDAIVLDDIPATLAIFGESPEFVDALLSFAPLFDAFSDMGAAGLDVQLVPQTPEGCRLSLAVGPTAQRVGPFKGYARLLVESLDAVLEGRPLASDEPAFANVNVHEPLADRLDRLAAAMAARAHWLAASAERVGDEVVVRLARDVGNESFTGTLTLRWPDADASNVELGLAANIPLAERQDSRFAPARELTQAVSLRTVSLPHGPADARRESHTDDQWRTYIAACWLPLGKVLRKLHLDEQRLELGARGVSVSSDSFAENLDAMLNAFHHMVSLRTGIDLDLNGLLPRGGATQLLIDGFAPDALAVRARAVRRAISTEALPAFIVDLDAFDHNVQRVADWVSRGGQGHTLRLATMSLRTPAFIERALAFGAPFSGVLAYSASEAESLFAQGISDVLLAYPTASAQEIRRICALHDKGAELKVVVDSEAHIDALSDALRSTGRSVAPLSLVIDLDASMRLLGTHLGVRRSPVRTTERAVALFAHADRCAHVVATGLMAYEAQVAALPDADPANNRGKNAALKMIRNRSVQRLKTWRAEVRSAVERAGFEVTLFNGGGSGSLDTSPHDAALTEVSAGSALYCPHLLDHFSNVSFVPAAYFALSVCRQSDAQYVTCAGGGYVASGAAGLDRLPLPVCPSGLSLVSGEGAGEVQTPLLCDEGAPPIGSPVLFRHAKAGEGCERFSEALLFQGGAIVGRAPTYRGLGATFL